MVQFPKYYLCYTDKTKIKVELGVLILLQLFLNMLIIPYSLVEIHFNQDRVILWFNE